MSKLIALKCYNLFFQTAKQTMLNYSQSAPAPTPIKSDLNICLHFIVFRVSKQRRNGWTLFLHTVANKNSSVS